jgi:glycosyltransferase involved in cell wall biosynthesis
MRILLVHNSYQQLGGEDSVFAAEGELLEKFGHHVVRYTDHNDRVNELTQLELARATVWNHAAYRKARALIRRERPDVMHVHNTLPLISPAVYSAARAEGVPVVQTLHNYRLLCPNGLLFRDGHLCEECTTKTVPWPSVVHACYRESRLATGMVAGMLATHRMLGTWRSKVDMYIALSQFSRQKFIDAGFDADRITVKTGFVYPDPSTGTHGERTCLYVGRLSPEKGVQTLLEAWRSIGSDIPLKIVGAGPLEHLAREPRPGVEWAGRLERSEMLQAMQNASLLIFPSKVYEGFPATIAEAFATGLPVLASRHGAMAEIVRDGVNGWHFTPRDAVDLATKVRALLQDDQRLREAGQRARAEFEARYSAEPNHRALMSIYNKVCGSRCDAKSRVELVAESSTLES